MHIAVFKETKENENRVALSPSVVKQLIQKGYVVSVERGAGEASAFSDSSYEKEGARVAEKGEMLAKADVIICVNPPETEEVDAFREGTVLISLLYHLLNEELCSKLASKKISAFSMDAIPRISRAQSMDVLSSQSNLAGYKAVLMGANEMTRIFPLMMTAAGTIQPSKVLIFGVGVAGLQAIATAKRLGAVVEATDVRPECQEQAESLGARFITVAGEVGSEGGYAKEATEEYRQKQRDAVNKSLFSADLVITTALVPGRKAPVLIDQDQVEKMKFGSVIVDMAVEQGGNCVLSKPGETVDHKGVRIMGYGNLPSTLSTNASELYARNVITFLNHLAPEGSFVFDLSEEITEATLITHAGEKRK